MTAAKQEPAEDKQEDIITPEERELLEGILSMGLDPERLRQKTADYTAELEAAIAPYAPDEEAREEEDTASNAKPNGNGRRGWNPNQPRKNNGQFGHGHGGREGGTKSPFKTGTPSKAPANATSGQVARVIKKGLKDGQGGKRVYGAAKIGKSTLDIVPGEQKQGGLHMQKHMKEKGMSYKSVAGSLSYGKEEKGRGILEKTRKEILTVAVPVRDETTKKQKRDRQGRPRVTLLTARREKNPSKKGPQS